MTGRDEDKRKGQNGIYHPHEQSFNFSVPRVGGFLEWSKVTMTWIPMHSTLPCLFTSIIVCQPEVILLLFNHYHQHLLTRVDYSCWNSSLYHQPRSFVNLTSLTSTANLRVPVVTPLLSHQSAPLYHQPRSFINSTLLTSTADLRVPVVTPLSSHQSNAQSFCPQHLLMPGVHHNTSQWTRFF